MIFKTVSEIDVNCRSTWAEDIVFLTIDMDWAPDFVIEDTLNLLKASGIVATFFITHDTPLLARIGSDGHELGIHPNYNCQLTGSSRENYKIVLERILSIVPSAKSVRSHSLTANSRLTNCYGDSNLKFECNYFVPWQSQVELKPWKMWNGVTNVPHFWEDDLWCIFGFPEPDILRLVRAPGLKVFDFHPIHIYLNTYEIEYYNKVKEVIGCEKLLIQKRKSGNGSREIFQRLLSLS